MNRAMKISRKCVAYTIIIATAILFVFATDHLLGRSDRIRFELEKEKFGEVNDTIVHFAMDNRRGPESLEELSPGYVDHKFLTHLVSTRSNRYAPMKWDPVNSVISGSEPFIVRGIIPKQRTFSFKVSIPKLKAAVLVSEQVETAESKITLLPLETKSIESERSVDITDGSGIQSAPQISVGLDLANKEGTGDVSLVVSVPEVETTILASREARETDNKTIFLPQGAIVVEAEHFTDMTYGFEIKASPQASGGLFLTNKEGIGDFLGQLFLYRTRRRSGDYFNIKRDMRPIRTSYTVNVPQAGYYHLFVRMKARRSTCSTRDYVLLNGKRIQVGKSGSPFVWLWYYRGAHALKKGQLIFQIENKQDGNMIDQLVLSPKQLDLKVLNAESLVVKSRGQSEVIQSDGTALPFLSLSYDTRLITKGKMPVVDAWIYGNNEHTLQSKLKVTMDLPQEQRHEQTYEISLGAEKSLQRFHLPLKEIDNPERREYLLRCGLYLDGKQVMEQTLVMSSPYDWLVSGPMKYVKADYQTKMAAGPDESWERFDPKFIDYLGVLDFGKRYYGNTYLTMSNKAIYAYTEIEAPFTGDYMAKAMHDDDAVLWINGKRVLIDREKGPAIRTPNEIIVQLKKGHNKIMMFINQEKKQWQASLFFRTPDYQVVPIKGVAFDRMSVAEKPKGSW
jgi:hypothetical protein